MLSIIVSLLPKHFIRNTVEFWSFSIFQFSDVTFKFFFCYFHVMTIINVLFICPLVDKRIFSGIVQFVDVVFPFSHFRMVRRVLYSLSFSFPWAFFKLIFVSPMDRAPSQFRIQKFFVFKMQITLRYFIATIL